MAKYLRIYLNGTKVRSVGGLCAQIILENLAKYELGLDELHLNSIWNCRSLFSSGASSLIEIHQVVKSRGNPENRRIIGGFLFMITNNEIENTFRTHDVMTHELWFKHMGDHDGIHPKCKYNMLACDCMHTLLMQKSPIEVRQLFGSAYPRPPRR